MNLNLRFAAVVVILQAILAVLMFFDVPIVRQVVSFLYLSFVPGYVFMRVLRLKDIETSESLIYSVGLSIALVMFIGLFVDAVLPIVGVNSPLSVLPLLTFINGFVLVMSPFVPKKQESEVAACKHTLSIRLAIMLLLIPVLGIVGSFYVSESQNSYILLFTMVLIAVFVIFGFLWKTLQAFHTLVLSVCTLSLLYMAFFLTHFVLMWDEASEFYVFRLVQINHYWNPNFVPAISISIWKANGMASTTILPTAFAGIARIDGTLLFQIFFPSLLVLVPAILYEVYRTQTNKRTAFIAAFLFISNSVALGWGNDIQKAAQLFYSLLLLVIFTRKLNSLKKDVLFAVFTIALVISHYSLAYIFTATLFFVYLVQRYWQESANFKTGHLLWRAILALVVTFAWNIYVSGAAAFNSLLESSRYVAANLYTNLLNISGRGGLVTTFLGASQNTTGTFLNEISLDVFRLSTVLIFLGFLSMMLKKSEAKFDNEFSLFLYFNMGILLLNVILPGLSSTFLMQRFYQTTLMVLSPLFVIGSDFIVQTLGGLAHTPRKTMSKTKMQKAGNYFIVTVLIVLFLFQSGFVYEVAKTQSYSASLSGYRINKYILYDQLGYSNAYDVDGARWLTSTANYEQTPIYCDVNSVNGPLLSYGLISDKFISELLNTTQHLRPESLIYLNWVNTVDSIVQGSSYVWNMTDIHGVLSAQDLVYTNGGCTIYSSPEWLNES
jgi:uncharacterized membrane protein